MWAGVNVNVVDGLAMLADFGAQGSAANLGNFSVRFADQGLISAVAWCGGVERFCGWCDKGAGLLIADRGETKAAKVAHSETSADGTVCGERAVPCSDGN